MENLNTDRPLVSIIIPTFNYGHLIAETLYSVVNQSYSNWECIIIDDGSTDNTEKVVAQVLRKVDHFRFRYEKIDNGGTSMAKNVGISMAKGELLQFLDADDLLSANKLKIQVDKIKDDDCALVFCSSNFFIDKRGTKIPVEKYPSGFLAKRTLKNMDLIVKIVTNNIVTISSPLVRASYVKQIGGFDPNLRNNEDWLLWFRIGCLNPYFLFDNDPESNVMIRIHSNSAMNQSKRMFEGEAIVRAQMDKELHGNIKRINLDLLALHNIRSLEIRAGFSYIFNSFGVDKSRFLIMFYKGATKLFFRIARKFIG